MNDANTATRGLGPAVGSLAFVAGAAVAFGASAGVLLRALEA
ncbi:MULTISPECIES: hypothetical protein [Halorussus]|nr:MULTISPECIES: hypothetical protein [Halorussus]